MGLFSKLMDASSIFDGSTPSDTSGIDVSVPSTDYGSYSPDMSPSASDIAAATASTDPSSFMDVPTGGMSSTGDYPMGISPWSTGTDSQQALGQLLNPSTPLSDISSKLATEGSSNPSFLTSLANQLGVKIFNTKDPLSSLSNIVGAIAAFRNAGPNGAQRQSAMSNYANLSAGIHSGYNGAVIPTAIHKPTYAPASSFTTSAPDSTGPLTLIKTNQGS